MSKIKQSIMKPMSLHEERRLLMVITEKLFWFDCLRAAKEAKKAKQAAKKPAAPQAKVCVLLKSLLFYKLWYLV